MAVRNVAFNAQGTIDLEVEHPTLGWIPFTASPDDPEQYGRDLYAAALTGAYGIIGAFTPPPPVTIEQLRARASLTRMEFFTALEGIGIYDAVWAMQDDETVAKNVRIMLRTASSFERLHPEFVAMAVSMGFSDADMDALFGIEAPA